MTEPGGEIPQPTDGQPSSQSSEKGVPQGPEQTQENPTAVSKTFLSRYSDKVRYTVAAAIGAGGGATAGYLATGDWKGAVAGGVIGAVGGPSLRAGFDWLAIQKDELRIAEQMQQGLQRPPEEKK